jgi:hypothetical protein
MWNLSKPEIWITRICAFIGHFHCFLKLRPENQSEINPHKSNIQMENKETILPFLLQRLNMKAYVLPTHYYPSSRLHSVKIQRNTDRHSPVWTFGNIINFFTFEINRDSYVIVKLYQDGLCSVPCTLACNCSDSHIAASTAGIRPCSWELKHSEISTASWNRS